MGNIRKAGTRLLDYLYPPRCPVCGGIYDDGICPPCKRKLIYIREDFCLKCGRPLHESREEYCPDCRRRRHFFDQGRSVFSYQGAIRLTMYRIKYSNRREYAATLGREMARQLEPWIRGRRITRIVPIPLHPSRKRSRGYNQSAILARSLGEALDLPVDERLLRRVKKTVPQKQLDGAQRRKNLSRAFALVGELQGNERILLVDDIYTTGSTVDAAALCLKEGGCGAVYFAAAAGGG